MPSNQSLAKKPAAARQLAVSTTPQERFSTALHNTARLWKVGLDRRMKDVGVSQAGWLSIAYIAKADTPLSQTELAALVQVEAATMVSTIDRLVNSGLVERVTSRIDRRVKHVFLTATGLGIYDRLRHEATAFREPLLANFDEDKLAQATVLLEQLQNLIENS